MTEDNSLVPMSSSNCEQIGCKTYINGNVGSGTVQEMSEWVEYMTFDGASPWQTCVEKRQRESMEGGLLRCR